MATPIAHAFTGFLHSRALAGGPPGGGSAPAAERRRRAALLVALAVVPDADLALGLLLGQRNLGHRGWTHGILFALAAAALAGVVFRRGWGFPRAAGASLAALASHAVLDMLTGARPGLHPAYGVALLAPFLEEKVRLPFTLLPGVGPGLLTARNAGVAALEILLFGGAAAWVAARARPPLGETPA